MKKYFFGLLLILISCGVFAGISPDKLTIPTMHGGDNFNQTITVTNEFNSTVLVELISTVDNNSKDFNGFNISFSDNNFYLTAMEPRTIVVYISFDLNILPEVYDININARYIVEVPQDPTQGYRYNAGGGGTRYIDKNIDRNIIVDKNIIIPVEVIKEQIVIRDKNIYIPIDQNIFIDNNIEKPYTPPEWVAAYIIVGAIIGGGFIIFYFLFIRK
jgi:hypothetical protein